MDVLGHEQRRALGAQGLHQVDDLLDDAVLEVAPRRCGPDAPSGQQPLDRRPTGVRGPPPEIQRGRDHPEGTSSLEWVGLAVQDGHAARARIVHDSLDEAALAGGMKLERFA